MTAPAQTHIEREFTKFIDRIANRAGWSASTMQAFIRRNTFTPTAGETLRRDYDNEIEQLRLAMRQANNERQAS
jgi:hypothetical protein